MGVPINVWRARIGLFSAGSSCSYKQSCLTQDVLAISMLLVALQTLLVFLIVGNIELNPGPDYKCPVSSCGFTSGNLKTFAYHQQIHSSLKNYQFKCPLIMCRSRVFATYGGLSNHINQFHESEVARNQTGSRAGGIQMSCCVLNCPLSFGTVTDLCHHLCEHLGSNIGIKCDFCRKSFTYFNMEKFRSHFEQHLMSDTTIPKKCQVRGCEGKESFVTNQEFMEHCCSHLSNNVSFQCPLQACSSSISFSDLQNFRSHLSIKHEGWRGVTVYGEDKGAPATPAGLKQPTAGPSYLEHPGFELGDGLEAMEEDEEENPITTDMFFKHIAHFYFMLLAVHFLPDSTVDVIAQSLKLVSELIQHQFSVAITRELKKKNMKNEDIVTVINSVMCCDVFYAAHHKDTPGPTFTSKHFRQEYMGKNLAFIPPQEVNLDLDKIDGAVAHLVPPADVLKLLLKDPDIQAQVCKSFERRQVPGLFQDYTDGSNCRSVQHRERIDLIVFADACNPVNVLGSAKNKYKMNGTYWTIGNLDQASRAKVDAINLAYLVNNSLISNKKYGPAKCFKPIVEKFKALETSGIEFMGRTVKVCVQYFTGDNLGAHEIGGFTGSFSQEYFCRFCPIKRSDFHKNPSAVSPFRTVDGYYRDLQKLSQVKARRPKVICYRGVKENSVLHHLDNFHVCDPRLPPCVAHDIFEKGVADYDLSEIISLLVKKNWFSYLTLQQRIKAFKCLGPDKENKPAPVLPSGKKLGGHAVQNWTLIRILPLILQDCIRDPNDEIWKLYLKLKQVVEYASAPAFTEADLEKMDNLNTDYIKERSRLLNSRVKPKHHFLLHYAKLIRLLGPIIHLFTLRFEAKHQFFKRVARACKNFINFGMTLAHRHQVWMAHLLAGSILSKGLLIRKTKPFSPDRYSGKAKEIMESGIFGTDPVDCVKIEMDGIKFKAGAHLLIGKSVGEPDTIIVGQIEAIVSAQGCVYFILQKFKSTLWQEYGVYIINTEPFDLECVSYADLKYPVQQPVYDFKDNSCFVLKHFLSQ